MNIRSRDESAEQLPDFEESFRRLFNENYASLFRYLHRLTGDVDYAEDLAQETFVRLYERGSLPDNVRGWMAAVAHNLLRDEKRTGARRLRLMQARLPDVHGGGPASADEQVLADERRRTVRAALDNLSERDRRLLLLRHEGYSYREIAHAVGVNETSVGTLLVRATMAFQSAFKEA
ncbi:MAG TPA: sigma-70 family RNA polymerase sigma factor [Gemmatimonadaceae bacterium]|nr:sigma-70 family RNA polymerase sigma factor [Gemmatimonadaceae bacterium]